MRIGQLLERDFSKPIEEIIKVNNLDEQTVYTELTEYIATDRIKDHYRRLLKAIVDAKSTPTEGIGVWISGFFGSGKSSFAKNLGYVLANRTVLGKPAGALFAKYTCRSCWWFMRGCGMRTTSYDVIQRSRPVAASTAYVTPRFDAPYSTPSCRHSGDAANSVRALPNMLTSCALEQTSRRQRGWPVRTS